MTEGIAPPGSSRTHASVTPRITPILVQDPDSYAGLLEALDSSPTSDLGLDTEADSFHHYFEKVCLIQLAFDSRIYLVDPLASLDLISLLNHLRKRRLLVHGADYDLRLLHRGYGFRAPALMDTLIAAQLVGEKELGLAALLKKRVGVVLDKANQRADWSQRPLGPELIHYAATDVHHLAALVRSLEDDLLALGRLPWHQEECQRLAGSPFSVRDKNPENDWRIKGTNALTARERAFARALFQVRESRARETDRPPFRVFTNDKLLAAARLAARGESDPSALFPGPRPLPAPLQREIREALAITSLLDPEGWPDVRRAERTEGDPALERVVLRLKGQRDARALALGLDPGILASKAMLSAAARLLLKNGKLEAETLADEAGFSSWRAEILLG